MVNHLSTRTEPYQQSDAAFRRLLSFAFLGLSLGKCKAGKTLTSMSLFDNAKRTRGDANDEGLLPNNSKRRRHNEHEQPQILANDDYIVG